MRELADARLSVDPDALAWNYDIVRAHTHGAEIAPAVKDDAYGLGPVEVAARLRGGCEKLSLARLGEGDVLRAAIDGEIDVCVPFSDPITPLT